MGTYHHSKVAIWTQVLWRCKFSRQQEANTTRRIRKDIEEEGKEGTSKTLLGDFGHILRNSEWLFSWLLLTNCKKKKKMKWCDVMRSKVNTRKRLAYNNDVRAVECGMNIRTAKRVHQKDIHRGKNNQGTVCFKRSRRRRRTSKMLLWKREKSIMIWNVWTC